MDTLQRKNLREIDGLNQRGGRTLSFIDLIDAGTVSPEVVAYCWTAIAHGASFLTAARPGGAGKSTVLANLLGLLPPQEEIVTVTDPTVLDEQARKCYLAHEIGAGHWYGYIWGQAVPQFFSLAQAGHRIAACLHADSIDETRDILTSSPLLVPADHFNMLDLLLFIHVRGPLRRVAAVYEATGDGHRLVFQWDESLDEIMPRGPMDLLPRLGADEGEYEVRLEAVEEMIVAGETRFERVRETVLNGYDV